MERRDQDRWVLKKVVVGRKQNLGRELDFCRQEIECLVALWIALVEMNLGKERATQAEVGKCRLG